MERGISMTDRHPSIRKDPDASNFDDPFSDLSFLSSLSDNIESGTEYQTKFTSAIGHRILTLEKDVASVSDINQARERLDNLIEVSESALTRARLLDQDLDAASKGKAVTIIDSVLEDQGFRLLTRIDRSQHGNRLLSQTLAAKLYYCSSGSDLILSILGGIPALRLSASKVRTRDHAFIRIAGDDSAKSINWDTTSKSFVLDSTYLTRYDLGNHPSPRYMINLTDTQVLSDSMLDIGMFHLYREAHKEAFDAFQASLELDPENYCAYGFMAEVAIKTKQDNLAHLAISRGLAISPYCSNLHLQKGILAYYNNEYETALNSFQLAFGYDRSHFDIVSYMALALIRLGRAPEAYQVGQDLLKRFPNNEEVHNLVRSIHREIEG